MILVEHRSLAMTDSSQFADLDRTLAALEQGVSTLSIDDAIALITAWQQELQLNNVTDLVRELSDLKQALQGNDPATISTALSKLGENTRELSGDLSGDNSAKVYQLGKLLEQAGG